MNAAGAAAGRVFGEVHASRCACGGRTETFAGLAGAGDLVATALAEHTRNRRAGELLGRGVPADQIRARSPQAAEALDVRRRCSRGVLERRRRAPAPRPCAESRPPHRGGSAAASALASGRRRRA